MRPLLLSAAIIVLVNKIQLVNDRLSALLARLPGIGEKTGLRLALALVKQDQDYLSALG